jgi:hypothetical protein
MDNTEFVAEIGNPYFTMPTKIKQPSEQQMQQLITHAVAKKAFPLFYDGCLKYHLQLPKEASVIMSGFNRRREKQVESAKLLLDIQEKYGVDLIFFKTFRPFNYIPDDVDVLLREEKDLNPLMVALKKEGYFLLKVGTPEVVFRKVGKDAYVDLDIHRRLAVGSLDLFEVKRLWQNQAFERIDIGDGYRALKLSEDYEVVREAAYSQLKDFNVSIPGLYLGINAMLNRNLSVIKKIAVQENLSFHLKLYLNIVYFVSRKLFGDSFQTKMGINKVDADSFMQFCKNIRVPYPYPVLMIASAYLAKVTSEIRYNKNLGVLFQVFKQPSSKGIGIAFDYIRDFML